jgi:GT2 family glycosyltransferase
MNERLFTCKFFEYFKNNQVPNNDFAITVIQPEYSVDTSDPMFDPAQIIKNLQENGERPGIPFKKENMEYNVSYENLSNINAQKAHALIPSRDSLELLKFTLSNLDKNNAFDFLVPVIIDDRSNDADSMRNLADQYNAVYIRVDYQSDLFNFSVLNNAAASFLDAMGVEDIVLWNSDLWVGDSATIPYLLKQHQENKINDIFVTGTKLLYPERDFCNLFDDDQFIKSLSEDLNVSLERIQQSEPFGKVQFGGSSVTIMPHLMGQHAILPVVTHYGRLQPKESVNFNREIIFMTGAFILCDLDKYKEVGGLNPSMRFCHQDGDLCFKMRKNNYRIMYYGKNCHLYHAESMSLASKSEKSDKINLKKTKRYNDELFSNELIFALKWNKEFCRGDMFI